ncbi:MAG: hypothetical protein SFV55_26670 [Haliscomenobacter sp.]|uniref:hypothetical protein n=1 Tax=Haliscomenobacter sp. TaxID=2717303 RepID=UPI0029A26730|nr:hypothetical protein [Haliscomenobacter sp.]MDX2072046.1 hypothetical protein [Haliscomenobacter sp.]
MEFAQLLQLCGTHLTFFLDIQRPTVQQFLDTSALLSQLAQNIGQLKSRKSDGVQEALKQQRQLSDQMQGLLAELGEPVSSHFQDLLKKSELLAASLELAVLDIPDYPLQQMMPGSARLKEIMRSFYTHPKLNQSIEQWLARYDLLDKIDPGEVILNGLRILTRSLAMGSLRSEEKALPFLLATCKNHIRDLRQSPQFKAHSALDERFPPQAVQEEQLLNSTAITPEALPYDQFLQAKIRPIIQQVVREIKGKCQNLLLDFFRTKFSVDFSSGPAISSDSASSSNYVYECLGRLRTRLAQEKELLTILQNIGFHVR